MSCTSINSSAQYLNRRVTRLATIAALSGLMVIGASRATAEEIDFQAMGWASACVTCHGSAQAIEGSSIAPLAGMPASELIDKMTAFAAGDVSGLLMQQLARGYDKETVTRIAQWYEKQGKEAK